MRNLVLLMIPLLHWTTGQQSSQYGQRTVDGKTTQLEDLDAYKTQSAQEIYQTQPIQQQTQQQQASYAPSGQNQIYANPSSLSGQSQIPIPYSAQQIQTQYPQQYILQPYLPPSTHSSYPFSLDFVNLPSNYLANLLYSTPQQYYIPQQTVANSLAEYYKTVPSAQTPLLPLPGTKSAQSAQVTPLKPVFNNSPVPSSATLLQQNYLIAQAQQNHPQQQQSYNQAQLAASPYYYNAVYQAQYPQKNVYSSGVKSTTPAVPTKGKEEPAFIPISDSGYKFEYPQGEQQPSGFSKVRLSG